MRDTDTYPQFRETLENLPCLNQSAATQLNRRLKEVHISNLAEMRMDAVEQTDLVGSLRKLANTEQPGR